MSNTFQVGDRIYAVGTITTFPSDFTDYAKVVFDNSIGINTVEIKSLQLEKPRIICDPNTPEVRNLIGKEVYYGDFLHNFKIKKIGMFIGLVPGWFESGTNYPFCVRPRSGSSEHFSFIQTVTEPQPKKMTHAQIAEALGYDFEIIQGGN